MHKFITNKFYFIDKLDKNKIIKQHNNTSIIYRNYKKKIDIEEIIAIKNLCSQKNLKFYLSNNFKIALKLKLNGAYIPAHNKKFNHLSYKLSKDFTIIGSAHNLKEIRIKELQKVKLIFLSSIFKINKNYLGLNKFKSLSKLSKKPFIALGGISKKNFKLLKIVNCFGMAGISFFE